MIVGIKMFKIKPLFKGQNGKIALSNIVLCSNCSNHINKPLSSLEASHVVSSCNTQKGSNSDVVFKKHKIKKVMIHGFVVLLVLQIALDLVVISM
jgi:predicted small secreted protein